ncbi:receptor tyrosine phosphatase type r2b, putative [Ixodes scapularis]|uniref:protein-tyrosine-phosphatase n=1 Tax=Ixodes scapularis TaxID=6945 RepID=B7PP39_IXOSC|nr:receptor tyrosine phosphatase type r2b, putative [Ixodes scapularis]|eukprot:XP_002435531.1 receptor tyrosine phosphatase type r2b, putative [Ixodes scapularis]
MRQENKEATARSRRSVSGRDGVHEWTAGKVDYNTSQEMGLPYYMAAQMTSATIRNRSDFTVGDGKYYGGFYNAPLVTGSTYDIGLAAEVDFEGATANLTFDNDGESLDIEMEEIHTSDLSSSKPIPVAGLQEYVQRMLICEGFKQEVKEGDHSIRRPKVKDLRTGLRIDDHSRVKLKPTPGIAFSDYINANYIDGYCRPKRYIATQGPRTNTVCDFWKMVWQENVCKIVMLTNLIEKGKAKCEQYWPDEAATYGDIQVHLMASETFPDYDVRQLHLTLADTTREVKHFHLRSWPDHGVPLYPNVLLAFRKKVNQYRAFNEAPVVVHCSAGVGRTGTYILLDTLQEQAMSEGVVDVVGQLAAIRKSRMNLVETLGFHKKRKFLVTQMPSTKDLAFWKLVHESGTRTIVTLDAFDSNEDDPTAVSLSRGPIGLSIY